ncbi:MAG: hypothetical protein M3P43_10400, partial [Actinomycetota bacterium]|nr:hypothetical protein [Actinomycetota bacterium]
LSLAESKAKSRVIRRILIVPQSFSREALSRPYAIPRLVYRPDATDPMQLERIQIEGERAAAEMFGPRTELPAPPPEANPVSAEGEEPRGTGRSRSTTPEADAGPVVPSGDPRFRGGPHKGERFSEVVDSDPGYLQEIADGKVEAVAKVTTLAQEWLEFSRAGKP